MEITELRDACVSDAAKAAFDRLVEGLAAMPDLAMHAHEQGFKSALRVERGEEWVFAAVPGDEGVLAYVRKPAQRGGVTPEAVTAAFPGARVSKSGEVIVRLDDAAAAERWLQLVSAAG
ncbi:hypothetical protein V8J36_11295 [Frigidibacter sp. MR17.14]|uniref:hypothetical protein n=1 Tax=Frigidibacter sp. MR17.14 TaxID=3126509 RepID=UPI0030130313